MPPSDQSALREASDADGCWPTTRAVARTRSDGQRVDRNEIRRAFFARLAESPAISTLGVDAERIAAHLENAGRRSKRTPVSATHMLDVALAAACVDEHGPAWRALIDAHERAMIAAIEPHLGSTRAIVTVRRMLLELRCATAQGRGSALDLGTYRGEGPLRTWLLERLAMRAAGQPSAEAAHEKDTGAARRLRLALELLRSERSDVRRLASAMTAATISSVGPRRKRESGPQAPVARLGEESA